MIVYVVYGMVIGVAALFVLLLAIEFLRIPYFRNRSKVRFTRKKHRRIEDNK